MSHPQADTIRGSYRRGWSIAMLAVAFDLTQGQVRAILNDALDDSYDNGFQGAAQPAGMPAEEPAPCDDAPGAMNRASAPTHGGDHVTAPEGTRLYGAEEAEGSRPDASSAPMAPPATVAVLSPRPRAARRTTSPEARCRTTAEGRGCQWIEGDLVPGRAPAYCGADRREGSSYCPAHHLRAYQSGTSVTAQREQRRRSARRLPAGGAEELDFA